LRSARDARADELLELDMSLLEVVPDDVVLLGDVVVVLGEVVVVVVVEVLGDVDMLPEVVVDGLVLDEVELGDVVVEVLVDGDVLDVPAPLVEVEPVAPVPDVPDVEPELLAFVSDEPDVFEPCDAAPVELESELLVPVPVLCAYETPNNAAIATAVKVFGNLLIWRSPVAE
jgi:hypothetical protein